MLAVDTNVTVRYLTRDDPEQFARASMLIRDEDVYVCNTVLPRVTLEDPMRAATALGWLADGMGFADALHLAGAEHCEVFVSFGLVEFIPA